MRFRLRPARSKAQRQMEHRPYKRPASNSKATENLLHGTHLKKIGETIIEKKRHGFAVTLGTIAEICNSNPEFVPNSGSIKVTMKDPSYIQKLEAANDFALRGPAAAPRTPAPAAQAPKGPQPSAPAYAPPVMSAAPAPGMGSSSNAAARHHAIMERMRREQRRAEPTKKTNKKGRAQRPFQIRNN